MAMMSENVETKPSSFEEAFQQPIWVHAMVEENDPIIKNSAWEIVPRLEGKSVVGSRWIYKVKQVVYGSVEKHKATFLAKGFSQVQGIDYEETFALVGRNSSIRSNPLSVKMRWKIHQMDVKRTFLNRVIKEEVYIEQLEGFETFKKGLYVYRLK